MIDYTRLSPLAAEMAAGMASFCDALESGEPVESLFTVRPITLDLKPAAYGADEVKHVRGGVPGFSGRSSGSRLK